LEGGNVKGQKSLSIVLIDDNAIALRSIASAFNLYGYQVDQYQDVMEFLQDFRKDRYDILITDFRMPHLNGLELIERIQFIDINLKPIIYTGYPEDSLIGKFQEKNLTWFSKPFSIKELIREIEKTSIKKREERCIS